jgi:hypothetical protein
MGLGFYLSGRCRQPHRLEEVQAWIEEGYASVLHDAMSIARRDDGRRVLAVPLHPGAEPLELIETETGLIASANTSSVGPGYHQWLCEILDRLGAELGLEWDPPADDGDTGDETSYFHTRNRTELERHFSLWLSAVARHVCSHMLNPDDPEASATEMSMAIGGGSYQVKAAALTPLGPRSAAWLHAVAEDPAAGRDFFAWWEAGRDADALLGQARYRMWNDVCWRAPVDDDESSLLDDVLTDLERAYALDSSRSFPWREWHDLNGYTDHEVDPLLRAEIARRAAAEPAGPLIGYRRADVQVHPSPGWSLVLPGILKQTTDADGDWLAYDATRTVRLTAFRHKDPTHLATLDEPEPGEDAIAFDVGPLRVRMTLSFCSDEDGDYYVASGEAAVPGRIAAITLTWRDPSERAWAESTIRTLRFRGT